MNLASACLMALLLAEPAAAPSAFRSKMHQTHPPSTQPELWQRTKPRAVVLIHGVKPHVLSASKTRQALFHDWQLAGSSIVQALGKDADVYAYAWSQNVVFPAVTSDEALPKAIRKLKFMGYDEIVLVGHSAGGLVARMLVEDHPELGVAKVVQVCSPNGGAPLAEAAFAVRRDQEPLMRSLTKSERNKSVEERNGRKIPPTCQFLCVVAAAGLETDGLVPVASQWTEDLQKQGIPAVRMKSTHWMAMRSPKAAEKIAEWVNASHPRWAAERVQAERKTILRD